MFSNVGIFLDNMAIRIDCVHHDLLSKKANESIGAYLLSESVSIGTLVLACKLEWRSLEQRRKRKLIAKPLEVIVALRFCARSLRCSPREESLGPSGPGW